MKRQFYYNWQDITDASGSLPRERVAYLLRAARSHGDDRLKKLASHHYLIHNSMELVA